MCQYLCGFEIYNRAIQYSWYNRQDVFEGWCIVGIPLYQLFHSTCPVHLSMEERRQAMKPTYKQIWLWEIYNRITGWFHLVLYQSSNHTDLPRHRQPRWVCGDVLFHQRVVGVPHSHRAMCRPFRWLYRRHVVHSYTKQTDNPGSDVGVVCLSVL